jgi:hypothetical protein
MKEMMLPANTNSIPPNKKEASERILGTVHMEVRCICSYIIVHPLISIMIMIGEPFAHFVMSRHTGARTPINFFLFLPYKWTGTIAHIYYIISISPYLSLKISISPTNPMTNSFLFIYLVGRTS